METVEDRYQDRLLERVSKSEQCQVLQGKYVGLKVGDYI